MTFVSGRDEMFAQMDCGTSTLKIHVFSRLTISSTSQVVVDGMKEEGEDESLLSTVSSQLEDPLQLTAPIAGELDFGDKSDLDRHKVKKPNSECRKSFLCSECGKAFKRKSNHDRHMMVHSGERRYKYKCDCGKAFTQKSDLDRHLLTHSGEKPHVCCQCGKSFTQKGTLDIHMKVHTGEKPHVCCECGNAFTRKGDLDIHMRVHRGERPYKCECGKAFTQKRYLDYHLLTHSGERPHVCCECGKSFTQKGNLDRHMKVHKKNQEPVVNEEELGITNEDGHGSDKEVGSDEITAGVEVYVKSEGAVKVVSVDNLGEESDPLNF